VDVRLVATTNRVLRAEVEAGRFRSDLYYRINVVPIRTPPLRERLEDVPLLVRHFVDQAASQVGVKTPLVLPETLDALRQRPWPGNIRELANAVERAVILCRGGRLLPEAFAGEPGEPVPGLAVLAPPPAAGPAGAGPAPAPAGVAPLNLKELERQTIERALVATGGHRGRAADLLGISERTLRNKLNSRREEAE
jgi:DNA-binding NtrC family response regulator